MKSGMFTYVAAALLIGSSASADEVDLRAALESAPRTGVVAAPGGDLDPARAGAGVYKAPPRAGKAPAGAACRTAEAYVQAIQSGRYDDVPKLYRSDAVVLGPMGKVFDGRDTISKFYVGPIAKMQPKIVAVAYTGDATDCMVALAAITDPVHDDNYKLSSIDHFTVDAQGAIVRMIVFVRP